MATTILKDVMPSPQMDNATLSTTRFRPYASTKHTVSRAKYVTSNDPRGYIPVYEYPLNGQWLMVDSDNGYVLWTGIWKALGNTKADIIKMSETQPELAAQLRRIRGGYLKIQGTWMPYEIALHLARRVAWPIRDDLIPLFGPTFPSTCLTPEQPGYGLLTSTGRRRTRRAPHPRPVTLTTPPAVQPGQSGHSHPSASASASTSASPEASVPFFVPSHSHSRVPYLADARPCPQPRMYPYSQDVQEYRNTPSYPQQFNREGENATRHYPRRYSPYPSPRAHARAHTPLENPVSTSSTTSFRPHSYRTHDGLIRLPPLPSCRPPPLRPPPIHTAFGTGPPTDILRLTPSHINTDDTPPSSTCTLPPISSLDSPCSASGSGSAPSLAMGMGLRQEGSSAVLRRLRMDDEYAQTHRREPDRAAYSEGESGAGLPGLLSLPSPQELRGRRRRSISAPPINAGAYGSEANKGNVMLATSTDLQNTIMSLDIEPERARGGIHPTHPIQTEPRSVWHVESGSQASSNTSHDSGRPLGHSFVYSKSYLAPYTPAHAPAPVTSGPQGQPSHSQASHYQHPPHPHPHPRQHQHHPQLQQLRPRSPPLLGPDVYQHWPTAQASGSGSGPGSGSRPTFASGSGSGPSYSNLCASSSSTHQHTSRAAGVVGSVEGCLRLGASHPHPHSTSHSQMPSTSRPW